MKFLNFTFIKLCVSFIPGVVAGFYYSVSPEKLIIAGILVFSIFVFAYFRATRLIFPDNFFGVTAYPLLFWLGMFTSVLHQPKHQSEHFIHFTENAETTLLTAVISEQLKPTLYQDRYIIKAKIVNTHSSEKPTHGKILVNLNRDSLTTDFEAGDIILLPFRLSEINAPLNPYQFNYRDFMAKQAVLKQIEAQPGEILLLEGSKKTPAAMAAKHREKVIAKLERENFTTDELSILKALLLGQRRDISKKIYEQYVAAGAVHILAVSGLHVGIILLILNTLLKPVERIKGGIIIKTVLLLILLWGFALLAGLSPSVVRAVSMFSFVAIGMQLKRKTSVMNSLFVSLFILLLINPYFIFQIGFQLSYLAVFSIVGLQGFIVKLFSFKKRPLKYFWEILSVSIAAQIGVLPLSLYYFHQFPALFFLSNLVVLPVLGIILGTGILVVFMAVIDILPPQLATFYGSAIQLLNDFIGWVSRQEEFFISEIPFSSFQNLAAYVIITGLVIFIHQKSFKNLVLILSGIIFFQIATIYEGKRWAQNEAFILHKNRNTIIAVKEESTLKVFHNLDSISAAENLLSDYKIEKNLKNIQQDSVGKVMKIKDKTLFVVDTSAVPLIPEFEPDFILLTNSPEINLERMLKKKKPLQVIADGSNYHSAVARWAETCKKQKVPFHHTGKKGAFRIFTEP